MSLKLVRKKSIDDIVSNYDKKLPEQVKEHLVQSERIVGRVSLPTLRKKDLCYLWDGANWYFLHLDNFLGQPECLENGDYVIFDACRSKGRYPRAIHADFYDGPPIPISEPTFVPPERKYIDNLGIPNPNASFYKGTVVFFNEVKGFGFIEPDREGKKATSGRDVMSPFRAIDMLGYKTLESGQEVEFQFIERPRGPYATYIRPL